jgi:acetyltransferase-like isoleucine patch superfamily enzyme
MKNTLKGVMRGLALLLVMPAVCSFLFRRLIVGQDRAIMGSTQLLSLIPGLWGQYLRTAFLRCALPQCDPSVVIEFGTILSSANARFGENVYIGPMCHIGMAELERDVLVGAAVHIPSGPDTHGTADIRRPIREQPGVLRTVRIGSGAWIGSGSIVMHDVGAHAVVAAGAVVTEPVPSLVVAGGVPARVLHHRSESHE